jgi:hypothetical protein
MSDLVRISQLSALDVVDLSANYFVVLDVADTAQSAEGSTKKVSGETLSDAIWGLSSIYISNDTTVNTNSANWQNTFTNFAAQSANNISGYTTVNTNSANWQNTFTNFAAQSANNISTRTTVNTNSANWQSAYTTVNTNSASWGTGGGGSGTGLSIFSEVSSVVSPNDSIPVHTLSVKSSSTDIDVALIAKGSGATLAQIPNNGGGGAKRGIYATDWQKVRGPIGQVASGPFGVISGGGYNTASGSYSTVAGGASNTASGNYAAIAGGSSNTVNSGTTGTHCFIGGGQYNSIATNSRFSGIASGSTNAITGIYDFIGCGKNSTIIGNFSTIAGGNYNRISSNTSTIGGGGANVIGVSAAHSTIAGGANNSVGAQYGTITGGVGNSALGDYDFIGGGWGNLASGGMSFIAGGKNAVASRYGQYSHASGTFSANGGAQYIRTVHRGSTSSTDPAILSLDGGIGYFPIPSNTAYSLNIKILGVQTDGLGMAEYNKRVIVKSIAGTSSLVSSVDITTPYEPNLSTDATVSVDNGSPNTLRITVTGISDEAWRWVAVVDGIEMLFNG